MVPEPPQLSEVVEAAKRDIAGAAVKQFYYIPGGRVGMVVATPKGDFVTLNCREEALTHEEGGVWDFLDPTIRKIEKSVFLDNMPPLVLVDGKWTTECPDAEEGG